MKLSEAIAQGLGTTVENLPSVIRSGGGNVERVLSLVRQNPSVGEERLNAFLEKIGVEIPEPAMETEDEETEETPLEIVSTPAKGKPPVISIMGQDGASFVLQGFLNDFCATGEFPSAIILKAPAGSGKSHTFSVLTDKLRETGKAINLIEVETASDFAVIDSDGSQALLQALVYSGRGIHSIVRIDEAHLINKCGAAMRRVIDSLIYGAGQGWKRSGSVTVEKKTYRFNTRFLTVVLVTNFPEKIIKGNVRALERRFKVVTLVRYTASVMKKLIPVYFKEKGMNVEPDALKSLLKMHRGTLEALDDFREKACGHHTGTITQVILDSVLPVCKFTLRGFEGEEIKALKWIAATKEPRTRGNLIQNFPSLDVGAFYRHCKEQETESKGTGAVQTPFLVMEKTEYTVTEIAKKFLSKNAAQFAAL